MTPVGYSLVLPRGWVRVPLRAGTREALEEKVFQGIEAVPEGVPRDRGMAYRAHVRGVVGRMADEARKGGGLDLYVPARTVRATAACFVVAEVPRTGGGVEELAGGRRAGAPGELREVGGGPAVRWEYARAAGTREPYGPPGGSRCVDYVLPVPRDGTRWLSASWSTPGDGDLGSGYTQALTDLFDAVVTTFAWTY